MKLQSLRSHFVGVSFFSGCFADDFSTDVPVVETKSFVCL